MKLIIEIDNMSCEHCAKRVEGALSNLDFVESVKVNLNEKKASLKCSNNVNLDLLRTTIEDLGYDVKNIIEE